MSSAEVYFANTSARKKRSLVDKVETLFHRADFGKVISEKDLVVIKVHFGEQGNTAFLPPIYARRVVKLVKAKGGRPFLTDGNTLYRGSRGNAVDHLETALANGFGYATVGAPLVIADGLTGQDYFNVKVNGKHYSEVKIATAAYHADALIAITHFKGHELTGFGGAIKNLGMGLGSRSAKQMMHSDVLPEVRETKCDGCGRCVNWCPTEAITLIESKSKVAFIDRELCYGCGECTVSCPIEAIAICWETDPSVTQEKIVEHLAGVIANKKRKVAFFNFLLNITPDCDCWPWSDTSVVPDIGILASTDPIAIDQASVDLINQTPGITGTKLNSPQSKDKFRAIWPQVDWEAQLAYGEAFGIGNRKYKLVEVG